MKSYCDINTIDDNNSDDDCDIYNKIKIANIKHKNKITNDRTNNDDSAINNETSDNILKIKCNKDSDISILNNNGYIDNPILTESLLTINADISEQNDQIQNNNYKDEYFKPLKCYEKKYKISNYGRVINIITGNEVKQRLKYKNSNKEYYVVTLIYNNTTKTLAVQNLMKITFFNVINKKEYVNHIDGNKKNNRLDNLEIINTRPIIKRRTYGLVPDTSTFRNIGYVHDILYDSYKINRDGVVINKKCKRLSTIKDSSGFDYVRLYNKGNCIKVRVDRLLGKIFLKNGSKYFENSDYIIKYKFSGDYKNLYWVKK